MFFPLILASELHGSWRVVFAVLGAVLFCYALAMLPGLLERGTGQEIASLVFYRLTAVGLSGLFLMYVARSVLPDGLVEDYAKDEDGSILLEHVEGSSRRAGGCPSPWYSSTREWRWRLWISSWRGCGRASGNPCCSARATSSGWS